MPGRFVTDQGLAEVPALASATPEQRAAIVADADAVWAYVRAGEWTAATDENALYEHFERDGVEAERVALAVDFLVQTGRLTQIGDPAGEAPGLTRPGREALEGMSLDDLQTWASRLGVKGRSKMNREQLIEAMT